jgi:hypothetical protein
MRVCLTPHHKHGGPASFQARLQTEFQRLGVEATYDPRARPLDAVLIFAGTKDLPALAGCRRDGVRIVQRLDGINWLHRNRPGSPLRFVRAELLNLQLRLIRSLFTDRIIYQSGFIRSWWEGAFGTVRADARVIHNGVALDEYPASRTGHDRTLLVVEGGLDFNPPACEILRAVQQSVIRSGMLSRLCICARTLPGWEAEWAAFDPRPETPGRIPREEVRARQARAALFLTMEINPPCPNAVIEALAAGLPVIGFDTGSAKELVGEGGVLVPYEGDPWKLEIPRNLDALGKTARRVLDQWPEYSRRARGIAERSFDIRLIARAYLEALSA